MKESEAKTKWCPMVRVRSTLGGNYNRNPEGADILTSKLEYAFKCIGSACMVWEPDLSLETIEISKDEDPPEGEDWHKTYTNSIDMQIWKRWVKIDRGDCGLKLNVNVECGG